VRVSDDNKSETQVTSTDEKVAAPVTKEAKAETINAETTSVDTTVAVPETSVAEQTQAEAAVTDSPKTSETDAEAKHADTEQERAEGEAPKGRGRRSPRHVRAAGQKRKKDKESKSENAETVAEALVQDELQFDEPKDAVSGTEATTEKVATVVEAPVQAEIELGESSVEETNKTEETPAPDAADSETTTESAVAEKAETNTVDEASDVAVSEPIKTSVFEAYVRTPLKSTSHPMTNPDKVEEPNEREVVNAISDEQRGSFDLGGRTALIGNVKSSASSEASNPVKVDS
jgi:ribonuclease E